MSTYNKERVKLAESVSILRFITVVGNGYEWEPAPNY